MTTLSPHEIPVRTSQHAQMVSITRDIAERVPTGFTGMCFLFCQHTTAGLTINENADPDVVHDMLLELDRLVPWQNPAFKHDEGNSAAHVKATLVGADLAIPVHDGRLSLGVWQGIYFCEFDGPRQRRVLLRFQAG
ncbi:MAG: YjbQ family protein [Victivallales bacterium]|nr:YjbQ family protein [Victivallales bacterium]MBT7166906.1 YjbQ family protein [Victivallales bacterium]MBT7303824.1 YjbQ family protein [Victivallales bacterium]